MSIRMTGGVERGPEVEFMVDGRPVRGFEGECVAAALYAAGIRLLRRSPKAGGERGFFCLMGVCQECVVRIDGRVVTSCMEPVRAGLVVELGGAMGWDPEGTGAGAPAHG
jgi:D-hydroxyproline dehydrogenase subunit gamma